MRGSALGVVVTINEGFFFQILLPLRRREEGSAPPAALPPEPCPSRRAGTAGTKRRCRGEPGAPHLSLIAAERARERKLPQTRQQNAGFRRLRASFLHTSIINLRAEIKDPRAKEIIDSARKRFPGAAHGQPPPTAGAVLSCSPTLHGGCPSCSPAPSPLSTPGGQTPSRGSGARVPPSSIKTKQAVTMRRVQAETPLAVFILCNSMQALSFQLFETMCH
ncbi:uncharacterized protein LOC134551479 [Prinia subflava]|uniref:uncharacterized protein LOC134551479 n=1 Tax=Prinia subflava TaxID=208062 RepID=UPI002FE4209D